MDHVAIELGLDSSRGAVVASEENQGVVTDAKLIELGRQLTDDFVNVGNHVLVVLVMIPAVRVLAVRGGDKGIVRQDHGVVAEERLVLVALHEAAEEIRDHIRTVFARGVVHGFSINFQTRVRVAGVASALVSRRAGMLPETGLIKAKVLR